jgi:hypothetical protein
MSLIFDALQKLDRERQTPERGVVVMGRAEWSSRESSRSLVVAAAVCLVGLGLVAGWWLYPGQEPARPAAQPTPSSPPAAAVSPRGVAAQPASTALAEPPAKLASRPALEAVPTVSVPRQAPIVAPHAPPVTSTVPREVAPPPPREFVLQAITQRDGRAIAMLNDRLVREGERFDGVLVVRIGDSEVEIEVEGRRRIIGF